MLEILHFGPGYRQSESPPHCVNMFPALIFHDEAIHVVELHFEPGGEIWEHEADHPTLFMVIEGSGYVRVGGEEAVMQAGQAVLWPAHIVHKAWAETEAFTAIVVEYGF